MIIYKGFKFAHFKHHVNWNLSLLWNIGFYLCPVKSYKQLQTHYMMGSHSNVEHDYHLSVEIEHTSIAISPKSMHSWLNDELQCQPDAQQHKYEYISYGPCSMYSLLSIIM